MRRRADAIMSALAGGLVRVFFSELEVTGAANLPVSGPTILVANHQNGLVDGLVLIAALRRYPRFLGKSTLWKIGPLRPFLALAGVVPIYRGADAARDPGGPSPTARLKRNDEAFARCRQLLADGAMVAVFPEGVSHDEPRLQELRTGVARIALGAAGDDGTPGVVIVPAGLVYDDKSRFRSRALVRIGPSRPVDPALPHYLADRRGGIHALTDDVAADLRAVAPDFASWDLANRCLEIAALLSPALADRERLADTLARIARSPDKAPEFDRLARAAAGYGRDLAVLGIADSDLSALPGDGDPRALPPAQRAARALHPAQAVLWSGAKVAAAAPLAAIGVAVHLVPYSIVKALSRRPANVGMRATVKLLGCFGLFSLTYAGLGLRTGLRRGIPAGLAAFMAAPACGYVALRSSERLDAMGGVTRSIAALRHHRASVTSLRSRRAEVVAGAHRLLAN